MEWEKSYKDQQEPHVSQVGGYTGLRGVMAAGMEKDEDGTLSLLCPSESGKPSFCSGDRMLTMPRPREWAHDLVKNS